jgi:hypothetical protein
MQIKNKGIVGLVVGLAVGLTIGVVVSLQAGPLTPPPTAVSGGVPVPTMKTLDQVMPTWDRTLPANDTGDPCNSSRFTCVMGNTAVRDNETGLVWTRGANLSGPVTLHTAAQNKCWVLFAASHRGWRLPKMHELTSLGVSSGLPIGHPFQDVQLGAGAFYWSDSLVRPNFAAGMQFSTGLVGVADADNIVTPGLYVWCVRGL